MGSLTTAEKNRILDSYGTGGYWLALFKTATGDNGSGTELAGGSYARQEITLDAAVGGITQNTDSITFENLPGADDVTDAALFDDVAAGTMVLHKAFASPIDLIAGQDLTFGPGEVVLTAD